MRRRRKTKPQGDWEHSEWEHAEAKRRAWEEFRPKLGALKSYGEAKQLVAMAPPPDSPGRGYYSNLGFFLQAFAAPGGASGEELGLYFQFIERLDAAGELKPGVRQEIEFYLRLAMKE